MTSKRYRLGAFVGQALIMRSQILAIARKWFALGFVVPLAAPLIVGPLIFIQSSFAQSSFAQSSSSQLLEWTLIDTLPSDAASASRTKMGKRSGEVMISVVGDRTPGSAFVFTGPSGVSLLFDPWRDDPSGEWGLWFPDDIDVLGEDELMADALLAALENIDHDTTTMQSSPSPLERMEGSWAYGDVRVIGFADNNITLIVMAGLRIMIWGEGLPAPDAALWDTLDEVDVLVLPIDDTQISLRYDEADQLVARLSPDLVIPGMFLSAGVSASLNQLGSAEEWTRRQNYYTILREPHLSVTAEWVHSLDAHVQYFGNNHLLD